MSKLCAVVVVIPLAFTSLACPTRLPPDGDGGLGGSVGATGGQTGGAGGQTTGGVGAGGAGGAAGVPGSGGASGVSGTAGASGTAGSGGKTADGGSCTNSQECQNGNCAESGSMGICCPVNYVNCGGSCVDLQSNANNCGTCGSSCGNLGCSSGQCGCTASTPNGTLCIRPGQTRGTCWGGACVLPAYFPGCNTADDCVPGGCTGPGGYCLGTVDVPGEVSCTAGEGSYIVCPTSQGCLPGPYVGQVQCGNGTATETGDITCDGPSDCPANSDCCVEPAGQHCLAQPQPGVIGSGCAAFDSNPNGPQAGIVCDPLNPVTTCPAGKSCVSDFGGGQVAFLCQ